MEGSGSPSEPHIYTSLCKVFDLFDPYLDRYPELSAAEAYERLLNNTLDRCYPVEKPSRSL